MAKWVSESMYIFIVSTLLAADLMLSDTLMSVSKILYSISSGMNKLQHKQSGCWLSKMP